MAFLVKSGRVIDPQTRLDVVTDILIEKGKISKLGKMTDDISSYDAGGKIVLPGLIDMHCHLRQPGREDAETIKSGLSAAVKGGFTSAACMPNTDPPLDNQPVVEFVLREGKRLSLCNLFVVGAITAGRLGQKLSDIHELKKAGVIALSDDGSPVLNGDLLRRAFEYANMFSLPLISHCEDTFLSGKGVMNEGFVSTSLGLKGIPSVAEEVMVSRDIMLSSYTGGQLHLAHISTRGSVELIREAKKKKTRISAETCPHYFSLTDEAVRDFNTATKVNPPLRSSADREAVIAALKDGTIDCIATDHAPHTQADKELDYNQAPFGISGLETALSLGITHLVKTKRLSLMELADKMSFSPSVILGLRDKGGIQVGKDADLTIISEDESYRVESDGFLSRGRNSPFIGDTLWGIVEATIVQGKIVYRRERGGG